jgi:WD40 repeat protein
MKIGLTLPEFVFLIVNHLILKFELRTKPHRITAFSVSPDSSRFATAYMDGSVLLYPTSPPTVPPSSIIPERVNVTRSKVICRSHVSVVTSLKFFPSSRVILSSGQDFSLSVIPADLPETPSYEARVVPARVMRGHTGTVTDTAIIGVGRNVISSSLDKKVRLWDVSSGEAIATLFANDPVTAMSLGDRTPAPPDGEESHPPPPGDEREVARDELESLSFVRSKMDRSSNLTSASKDRHTSLLLLVFLDIHCLFAILFASGDWLVIGRCDTLRHSLVWRSLDLFHQNEERDRRHRIRVAK